MTVHQLLFGYDQGHDLLAGSAPLPPDARHRALILSDLSGAEPNPAFDGYLTGYPLPSMGTYALARTWYAPEMPRPGCVWTHTLLVSFADLAALLEPRLLLSLFKRPEVSTHDTAEYTIPLTLEGDEPQDENELRDPSIARKVLWALYADVQQETPPPTVAVKRDRPGDAEALALAVWAQQWPRLRRVFSFCTGALELRTIDGVPLDLQVTPQSRPSLGSAEVRIVTDEESAEADAELPPWLEAAFQDLVTPGKRDFRHRLRTYGADVPGNRWAYATLATIASFSRDKAKTADLIRRLSEPFPDSFEGGTLKAELLGRSGWRGTAEERERLTALLTTSYYRSFDPNALGIDEGVDSLWSKDRGEGLALLRSLLETEPNPWGRHALQLLVAKASPTELFRSLADSEVGVQALFERRPELLHEPKLWSSSWVLRNRAIAALRERPDADWEGIARAMLDAGVEHYADDVETYLGDRTTQVAIDWLLAEQGRQLPGAWLSAVSRHVGALAELAEARPKRPVGSLLLDLGPTNQALRTIPPAAWMPLRDDMGRDRSTFDALLLSLGLFDAGGQGRPVVEDLFQIVHDSVSSLSTQARRWITLHAPSSGWMVWETVSLHEQVRRALVRRALNYGWDANVLLRAARKKKTQAALASTLKRTSGHSARHLYKAFAEELEADN